MFGNIILDRPKLRRSVVARALQNFVSSTPLLNSPYHLTSEHSLNMSPINSIETEKGHETLTRKDTHFLSILQTEEPSKIIHKG